MEKFLEYLVNKFELSSKTIYRQKDSNPYLTRYYLFQKPLPWLPSIYLHCFHSSDEDLEFHNHPWNYSFSILLSGMYREYFLQNGKVKKRILSPGNFNFINANKFHRIELISDKTWTLFISGGLVQNWGFINTDNNQFLYWQEHERLKALKGTGERSIANIN